MQRFILVVFILALLIPVAAFGQGEVNKTGVTAANFLKLDVGARSIGLAGAMISQANDGSTMIYNPAGIAGFDKITFTYHNIDLYADIRQQFTGVVVPFGEANAIGFFVNYVDLGYIFRTTIEEQNGQADQFIFNSNIAYGLTFARQLTDRVLFGVTAKYAVEKIWTESAVGVSFDFGTVYEPGVGGLKLGLAVKHLGPDMRMDRGPAATFYKVVEDAYPQNRTIPARLITDKYRLPTTFTAGASFDFIGPTSVLMANDVHRFTFVSEVNDAFDAAIRSITALEYEFDNMVSIRGGTRQNYDLFSWSMGGGLKIPVGNSELLFDYAYADYGDLEGVYVTSLEIRF
ncbi:PorV/PorQ family protein [candidate division KSB1 bacterium]